MSYHQRRRMMDKMPTEGIALGLTIAIMFGGTLVLNFIVYGFIG